MQALLAELRARGVAADVVVMEGTEAVRVSIPFEHRAVEGHLDGIVDVTDDCVVLASFVPVLNVSAARFAAVMPDDPAPDEVDWDYDVDQEKLTLVAIEAGATQPDSRVVIDGLIPRVLRALQDLLDAGAIDVTDVREDDDVTEMVESIVALKESDPRQAIERCLEAAGLCRSLGNPTMGSYLDVLAAELLLDLGEVGRAEALVTPAWEQMDEPTYWREVVVVVAQLRVRQGRAPEGVALLEASLGLQDEPLDRAMLLAALGAALAESGREVEASRLFDAASNDPALDEVTRAQVRGQLDVLRARGGASVTLRDPADGIADVVEAAIARLNALAALIGTLDRPGFVAARPHIVEWVALVALDAERLGPAQKARLDQARAYVAFMDGHLAAARGHFASARELADESGDVELAHAVRLSERTMLDPLHAEDDPSLPPMQRVMTLVNMAYGEMQAVARRWLGDHDARPGMGGARGDADRQGALRAQATALRAIEVVDTQRHRYTSVADRAAWSGWAGKAYEVGLAASVAVGDHAEVVEILERARAQGAPLDPADEPVGKPEGDVERGSSRLLSVLRASLGDRPVARPLVASLRSGHVPSDEPVERVDLDGLVAAIAGGPAWWWGCHAFGERFYWALRSPEGRTWSGSGMLHDALDEASLAAAIPSVSDDATRKLVAQFHPTGNAPIQLADLPHIFRSVHEDDADPHVLLGDEEERRDDVLRALAKAVLPAPLVTAIREAAGRGKPLRLVWAPPRELARVPIGLLPIGDEADPGDTMVLLEGAVVMIGPPTSVAVAGAPTPTPRPSARPVLLVMGTDPDLGSLNELAGRVAPTPASTMGAVRHVTAGTAGAVAKPEAVLEAWRANPKAVAVYYGHVLHDEGASSASAALSLTEGRRQALLPASRLLVPDREGAPHTVVLAGCSSLSTTDAGSGEWWGLATGLLWQGSSHVIGSAWDVRTVRDTEDLVAELTHELRVADDPANALHRLQLARYRAWRQTGTPLPYDWSGWSIVSTGAAA